MAIKFTLVRSPDAGVHAGGLSVLAMTFWDMLEYRSSSEQALELSTLISIPD